MENTAVEERPAGSEEHNNLVVRMLYDEQVRLRAELDSLRQKQETQGKAGENGKPATPDDGSGPKPGSDGEGKQGDDKKAGDPPKGEGGGDDKDERKRDEKKPPLFRRIGSWIKNHPVTTVAAVLGAIVLVIAGILLLRYFGSYETTDDAFVDGHTDPISARINGFAVGVYVEDTHRVKKGQLLVQLDPQIFQVAKEQAAAQYAQAQAGVLVQSPNVPITSTTQNTQVANAELIVASGVANVAAAEERYNAALANVRQAEATEALDKREEERYGLLVAKEEVSREIYDQQVTNERAQTAVVSAQGATALAAQKVVTQAVASLSQARETEKQVKATLPRLIAVQQATLVQSKANAKSALAAADQAELNLQYTRIYAPANGIIGDKSVQLSSQVTAGQQLFDLTETDDIWITANFKETDVGHMRPGQSVTLTVDALSQKFDGYVEALPGGTGAVYSLLPPENATGNYVKVVQRLPVRIRLKPNQPHADQLAPGMSVVPKVWIK